MTANRGRAALLRSTALLLVVSLALPAQASAAGGTRHHVASAPDPDAFDPGDDSRAALSRLVAEPETVLKAYAPTRGGGMLPEPADVAGSEPTTVRSDADLATGTVPPPVDPGQVAPADETAPAAVATSPSDPAAYAPVPDDGVILNAATLQRAVEAWVDDGPALTNPRRAAERAAIAAFYAERDYAPLWVTDGDFDARARSASARIDRAAEDGLDLKAFPVTTPKAGDDAAALAAAELSLSEAAVDYGRQASGGRVDPARIDPLIAAKPDVAAPDRVLAATRDAIDPAGALLAFNPRHEGYRALKTKLAELRRTSDVAAGREPIPYGPALKTGMRDARVPLVRARFGLGIPPTDGLSDELVYDTRVASAVADYQRAHHMPASGVLTTRTVASLSGGQPQRLEAEIVANMERWRWLPRDLGDRYVAVNIPDFSLDVIDHGQVVHHARVVVGKPDHQTPVFSETMKFIIVNPYWNVPLSIVKKEMMPKLAANPSYFADHGYEVVERNGETYVRQPPGDSNALGRIKFMFPNKFSVYLHDTNAKSYFARDVRALSHGCVRVDQPFALAEAVLGQGWSAARVERMIGGDERTINLRQPVQVHINYFTAFVDDEGALRLRDDVYGYSARVQAMLASAS